MKLPNKETLENLRKKYPAGTRVALVQMADPQAPPIGTKGTVLNVDDIGSLIMKWDNGSGLNVVFDGGDRVRKLTPVTVYCNGKEEQWEDRTEAERFYLEAMTSCEGSERDRYTNIYLAIKCGDKICRDEEADV